MLKIFGFFLVIAGIFGLCYLAEDCQEKSYRERGCRVIGRGPEGRIWNCPDDND